MIRSTPIMSASTASFWLRMMSSTFSLISCRYSTISSICCCIACCCIMVDNPTSAIGPLRSTPGPCAIWIHCFILPGSPIIAWLTPGVLVAMRPYFLTASADSAVSFTQRPEFAASSEPNRTAAPPVPRTGARRCRSRSFDGVRSRP